jgi:hypothetical protein
VGGGGREIREIRVEGAEGEGGEIREIRVEGVERRGRGDGRDGGRGPE